MKTIIILEKGDNEIWGRTHLNDYLITTVGNSKQEIADNIRQIIRQETQTDDLTFDFRYDLSELSEKIKGIKIRTLAQMADMNPTLLQQYVNGVKFPTEEQTARIQNALHALARQIQQTKLIC